MIDTLKKLEVHLKLMKRQLERQGCDKFQLYPVFCTYYTNNKEKYQLPKEVILNKACEILVEED